MLSLKEWARLCPTGAEVDQGTEAAREGSSRSKGGVSRVIRRGRVEGSLGLCH